jgi:hypothetical protein
MGTKLEGVFLTSGSDPLSIAHAAASPAIRGNAPDGVVHIFDAQLGGHSVRWAELSDATNRSIGERPVLAMELSRTFGSALWIHYSDTSGADEYVEYVDGRETRRGTGVENFVSERFGAEALDADELFEAIYDESSSAGSFTVWRGGMLVDPPQPWVPAVESARGELRLDHEFESLRGARQFFRYGVYAFGGVVVLVILAAFVAFAIEMLR